MKKKLNPKWIEVCDEEGYEYTYCGYTYRKGVIIKEGGEFYLNDTFYDDEIEDLEYREECLKFEEIDLGKSLEELKKYLPKGNEVVDNLYRDIYDKLEYEGFI